MFYQIPLLGMGAHGGVRVLVDFANQAARMGAHVRFLVPKGQFYKDYPLHERVEVKAIGPQFGGRVLGQLTLLLLAPFYMRRGTLVANFYPTFFSVILASFLFRRPYLYLVQDIETWGSGLLGFFLSKACRLTWHSSRIIATSTFVADALVAKGYRVWKQVKIGVSDVFFETPLRSDSAKSYDLICFPRAEPWKRLDRLRNVMELYRRRYGSLRVLGVATDEECLVECRSYGAETLLPRNEKQLISAFDSARLVLFTSAREGLGLPPLEGMARGLPSVAYINEGTRVYLADQKGGFLIPDGADDQAAERIHDLLSDTGAYAKAQQEARAVARSYSTSIAFEALIKELS